MTRVLAILRSVQGRLITGLVFAVNAGIEGTLLASSGVNVGQKITFSATLTAAFFGWVFANIEVSRPHPHDQQLATKLKDTLTPDQRRFLRENDFGWSFPRSDLDGIREVARWEGPEAEFHDTVVQRQWLKSHSDLKAFMQAIALLTAPVRGNVSMQTVHPTTADQDDPSDRTREEIQQLNQLASSASDSMDGMLVLVRDRLGIAL